MNLMQRGFAFVELQMRSNPRFELAGDLLTADLGNDGLCINASEAFFSLRRFQRWRKYSSKSSLALARDLFFNITSGSVLS